MLYVLTHAEKQKEDSMMGAVCVSVHTSYAEAVMSYFYGYIVKRLPHSWLKDEMLEKIKDLLNYMCLDLDVLHEDDLSLVLGRLTPAQVEGLCEWYVNQESSEDMDVFFEVTECELSAYDPAHTNPQILAKCFTKK